MRLALLLFILVALLSVAQAGDVSVRIHSERPFGYFVGDLIHARIDVRAPPDFALSAASLPHPGPLTVSLDLRDVVVEETRDGGQKLWRLHLTYQNFYVALDVRNIDIPGFSLSLARPASAESIQVPAWRVGVAPLREIIPEQKEKPQDYLRPDGPPDYADEARPGAMTFALAAATALGLLAVARDRAWPPFRKRRARIFSALARRLTSAARRPCNDEEFGIAVKSLHRAIDAAGGRSVLADDVPEFLLLRPEFGSLQPLFQRFFGASNHRFFGRIDGFASADFGMAELARFAQALAERERAG